MYNTEKPILVVGLGSIGRRHVGNLKALGFDNILLYRTGKSTLQIEEFFDLPTEYDLQKALSHDPIAVIIGNPTAYHLPIAIEAAKAGSHIFLEKPISHTKENVEGFKKLVEEKELLVMVGFQYRFHPALQRIKEWLKEDLIGKVVSAEAHYGEYLPDWHPWEDYRESYSAKQDLGGGVLLTLCHPIDYLRWLIGEVQSLTAVIDNLGGLGIEAEDTALLNFRFASNALGTVYLDYVEKPTARWLHIVGQKGTIHWDDSTGKARIYQGDIVQSKIFVPSSEFERNSMFKSEIKLFLDSIFQKEDRNVSPNLEDGIKTLEIILAAKEAAKERKWIDV